MNIQDMEEVQYRYDPARSETSASTHPKSSRCRHRRWSYHRENTQIFCNLADWTGLHDRFLPPRQDHIKPSSRRIQQAPHTPVVLIGICRDVDRLELRQGSDRIEVLVFLWFTRSAVPEHVIDGTNGEAELQMLGLGAALHDGQGFLLHPEAREEVAADNIQVQRANAVLHRDRVTSR